MIPWFQFTTIHLGPIPIQVWGFWVALGMIVAIIIIRRRAKQFGENADALSDLALWVIVGGLIGARAFHVFLYEPAYYLSAPIEIIKVWHGGLSSFGGLFGAAVGFFIKMKRSAAEMRSINRFKIADILAYAAVYGWMIGRIGCLMIHDHPGMPCNGFLSIRWSDGTPRLDMALLEIIAMIPLAIFFYVKSNIQNPSSLRRGQGEVWVEKKKKTSSEGSYVSVLFIYYGTLRFILDFFRATDLPVSDVRYFGLTPAQYFAMVLVVGGALLLIDVKRKA